MTASPTLTAIMGPTGTGKTALAEALADETGALLISADAFQVYRGLVIGVNKPEDASRWEMVDICGPTDSFGVGEFIRQVLPLLEEAWSQGRSVVVAGGTGLYIRALLEEYQDMKGPPDPALREELSQLNLSELRARLEEVDPLAEVDLSNPVRVQRAIERALTPSSFPPFSLPAFTVQKIGLDCPPEALAPRLEKRLDEMIASGWKEEVQALLAQGVPPQAPAMRAIGYQAWQRVLEGALSEGKAREEVFAETRQYAKRQRSWLRSEPRLSWRSAPESPRDILQLVQVILSQR